jgi:hypothetical protein
MLINLKGIISHISKIGTPYFIWYPMSLLMPELSEDYIRAKLGITKPEEVKFLQEEFMRTHRQILEEPPELLETHTVRYDNYDWYFHLAGRFKSSLNVFLERGLTVETANHEGHLPQGYAWAVIQPDHSPEDINQLLYCGDVKFAKALHKKLKKIMGW